MPRVSLLTTGWLRVPAATMGLPGGWRVRRLPVVVAVVERPAGIVLIDAGFGALTARDPAAFPGVFATRVLGLQMSPGDEARAQLSRFGMRADDVRDIVVTHLHQDHVGGLADFPKATVHVVEEEYAAAMNVWRGGWRDVAQHLLRFYHPGAWEHGPRWNVHALEHTPALGFPRSLDLFGDGDIVLLETPGHTAGHTAVAVRLQGGTFVHVGDAALAATEWTRNRGSSPRQLAADWNLARTCETRRRIGSLSRADDARVIVCSHDPILFAGLRQAPQSYD